MSETNESNAVGWPAGVAAMTLFVDDLAECKRFYQSAFGLPVTFEDENSAVFQFGPTLVNLLKSSAAGALVEPASVGASGTGSRAVFTIVVDDVDAVCAGLAARGVQLLNGPMDRPWGPRTASFCDPSGHIWELARW
jgi:catechol 2,3-dioxygenase-like lactoylglutathione lyase family enzyme